MKFLILASLFCSAAVAQDIEFQFQVYETDPTIGAALEERLISGGEGAAAAIAKLPEFIRQKRITELDSLSLATPSGESATKQSGQATITLPTRDAAKGLEIEIDPTVQADLIDCKIYASYTTLEKGDPVERIMTTQTRVKNGIPMLICRWQREEQWLLLIGTATISGAAESATAPNDIVFVESSYYRNTTAAKFARDRLASTLLPCQSGQRCRAEIVEWLDDENILEDDQPGFRSRLHPVLHSDGTLKLQVSCGYIVESGGRTRLDNGDRVRRLAIRSVSATLDSMKEGEPAGRKAELAELEDLDTKQDDQVAAFRFWKAGSK